MKANLGLRKALRSRKGGRGAHPARRGFPGPREVLEAVLSLPRKYREVVYLHDYEGYAAPEISRILGKNVNTVYTLLTRSRQLLREKLGGEEDA